MSIASVRRSPDVRFPRIAAPLLQDFLTESAARSGDKIALVCQGRRVTYRTLEMQVGAVVEGRLDHAEPGTAAVVELKRAAAD